VNSHCVSLPSTAMLVRLATVFILLSTVPRAIGTSGATRSVAHVDAPPWTLVWSDEFNGANGSAPDPGKWVYDVGGNGWGNSELEYYTKDPRNAFLEDGNLVIRAIKEKYASVGGISPVYTSARLKTQGKFSQAYGKFEARIKIPHGKGLWPAFWLLGDNIDQVEWPNCGEIDIMENIGIEPSLIHGSMHGPGYSHDHALTSTFKFLDAKSLRDDFHVYAVEWEPNVVRFYLDGKLYATFTPDLLPAGSKWVFDHPFFILLNVAVGGGWPGPPVPDTVFPQSMLVDYVRVYRKSPQ
jgi:beta-glucanase (GH16 family)